jgi:hypothetical protein
MSAIISSERIERVNPGDLITAAWMNELIDTINDLRARVASLEGGRGDDNVVITDLIFAGTLRLGDPLEIRGENFGFSSGTQEVKFDNTRITEFRPGSSDLKLLVRVPALSPFPEEGRDVLLTVSNGFSSAHRTLSILPADNPVSGNLVDVLWETVTPNPVSVGSTVRLGYRLRSRVGASRIFTINPVMSRAELNTGIQVLDQTEVLIPSRQIQLGSLQEKLFFVVLPAIPAAAAGATFSVTVSAVSGGVTGSDSRPFTVGATTTPDDPTITVSPTNFSAVDDAGLPQPSNGSYNAGTKTIGLRAGSFGTMDLEATFRVQGNYSVTLIPTGAVGGWTRTLITGTTIEIEENDVSGGKTAQRPIRFSLQVAGGAAPGQIELVVKRIGQTPEERLTFQLTRIT